MGESMERRLLPGVFYADLHLSNWAWFEAQMTQVIDSWRGQYRTFEKGPLKKYRWTYKKYLCSRLSPVDKRGSVPMGPSVMPKKTKFGRKVRNFNKHTEFVSYYLIPDSKPNIWRARSTKTVINSLRVINLGKPSIPNNKSLLDRVPSRSTN